MIGFKIDNCKENKQYLEEIFSLGEQNPIEIGLECYGEERYFDQKSDILKRTFELAKNRKIIVHLTLKAKVLNKEEFLEEEWLSIWKEQAKVIEKQNIAYVIVHATSKESKVLSEKEQIEIIHKNFQKLKKIIPYPIYIENTYEDLDFYKKLFLKADKDMNFVFDIGHKKVHSKESMSKWIEFLLQLKMEGRGLHFHIHDNNGISDLHKPISFYNDKKVIHSIQFLMELFPTECFILEQHGNSIIDNFKDYIVLNTKS